jgi:hypothetical protein
MRRASVFARFEPATTDEIEDPRGASKRGPAFQRSRYFLGVTKGVRNEHTSEHSITRVYRRIIHGERQSI